MRVGIAILPDQRWSEAERRWRQAEEWGFDHAWTYDHLGWRDLVDGPWFDAVPTLTAAAMVTSRIRLGTLVASPNFRHPVHFARQVTALDDVSGGRMLLGVGAGGIGFDADVLGVETLSPRARVDRFTEFVQLLDVLLREDRVTWRGAYYSAIDARSTPGCVQEPRVPFIVAANGPRSLRLAARYGQGRRGRPGGRTRLHRRRHPLAPPLQLVRRRRGRAREGGDGRTAPPAPTRLSRAGTGGALPYGDNQENRMPVPGRA